MMSVVVPIETQPGQQGVWDYPQNGESMVSNHECSFDSQCMTPGSDLDTLSETEDRDLVSSFKHLLKMYSAKMSEAESSPQLVSSGGLQQYIIKSSKSRSEHKTQQASRHNGSSSTTFFDLPENAQLHILSYLDIHDLCKCSRVCLYWSNLATDNMLWRKRLEKDVHTWDNVGYTTNPDMYHECQSDWSYKDIYLRCSPEVNHMIKQNNVGFHNLSSILRSFWPKKTPKLAMFGPGLESSTSILARKILEDKSGLFVTTGMFPGQFEGVGSGFTLKMNNSTVYHLVTLYTSTRAERQGLAPGQRLQHNRLLGPAAAVAAQEELGEGADQPEVAEIRQPVKDLCRTLDGFVFVVDATQEADAVKQGRHELLAMVSELWTSPAVPVVVLSCVPDTCSPRRWSCMDVVAMLQLGHLNRPWQVHNCTVQELTGVVSALEWVVEQAQRR